MNISSKLTMYLECEKEKLDTEFPQNIETTILLFVFKNFHKILFHIKTPKKYPED